MADVVKSNVEAEVEEKDKNVLVTAEGQVLEQTILGTMNIELPEKGTKNKNRLQSMKFAVAGLLYLLKREQSIQSASIATVVVVVVGLWLGVSPISWALLVLALGIIWITEALNTAIEASIDLGTDEPHAMAKIGKDVAATASLLATVIFVLVVVFILVPPLLREINQVATAVSG